MILFKILFIYISLKFSENIISYFHGNCNKGHNDAVW